MKRSKSTDSSYSLIDSGQGKKLERFGSTILIRPEPKAIWESALSFHDWKNMAHSEFIQTGRNKGTWNKFKAFNPNWKVQFPLGKRSISFELRLTSYKHIGIFPEQASNWNFIFKSCQRIDRPKVLNLFAYTGGASLAAKAGGADVVHVDSVRQVVSWAKTNMEHSDLADIRWVIEDALKFVSRELKRGNKYHGIILDPPAYGIGAKGERWKIEEKINELLTQVGQLLVPKTHFAIVNTYTPSITPKILESLIKTNLAGAASVECRENVLMSESQIGLPMGSFGRIINI